VIGSLELGSLVLSGRFVPIAPPDLTIQGLAGLIVPLLVGSVILSVLVGGTAAAATYLVMVRRGPASHAARLRERQFREWINAKFLEMPAADREFVRWKLRLDRLFAILLDADLGQGPVVDLGCGHGVSLGLAAFRDPQRPLAGCDLDAPRIAAARHALRDFDASLSVADVRDFVLPDAGLILILDVLQYLDVAEQSALLRRCADALVPGGRLIFRVPDPARGVFSWTTYGLDRVVWWKTGAKSAPRYCDPTAYRQVLVETGMRVEMRSYRNRLPFRHLVVVATKPLDTT
jgi:SAM-dependent methyltransferase